MKGTRDGHHLGDLTTQWVSVLLHARADSGSTMPVVAFEKRRCPASLRCLLHLLTLPLVRFLYQSGRSSSTTERTRSAELCELRPRGAENLRLRRKWQGPGCPGDGHSPLEGDWRVVACCPSPVSSARLIPRSLQLFGLHSTCFPVSVLFLVLSVPPACH